ncbi:L,D-transpeptidase family protein [Qipengyuania sediminis]|uniref:L,D-transpeptidase family protein n=1 Tax=Qipengyuania sediminis TaxID=1532023 RepID=UPI0010598E30|nr:L,D-transpeptidase family protein [Qipengyuania sediminis]
MRRIIAITSCIALAACGLNGTDRYAGEGEDKAGAEAKGGAESLADSMASTDGRQDANAIPDPEKRPIMQAQVVLDRIGFMPGVVDGKMGMSTVNALKGFQEANNLQITGKLDQATAQALAKWQTIPATRVVTIPADWGQEQYFATPEKAADQAKLESLAYTSLDERLAERFHTTVETLKALNPGGRPAGAPAATGAAATPSTTASATTAAPPSPSPAASGSGTAFTPQPGPKSFFTAGQQIRVPNIGADRIEPGKVQDANWQRTLTALGVGTIQPKADRLVVSKSQNTLKTYDASGKLTAIFTVSSGSSRFPLPLGNWEIRGKSFNPDFNFNPELLEGVDKSEGKHRLPPGPNSPVGVVWIDLSKEHYGIHGTPEPETIGRAQSSGCVRLTNWDAARLAQMVSTNTKVEFVA